MKSLFSAFLVLFLAYTPVHAGCREVIKLVGVKSLELSIIVEQKTASMNKIIVEANAQTMAGIKTKKASIELPDLMTDLNQENGELSHVNSVLGMEIGKLIKNNPKCFK